MTLNNNSNNATGVVNGSSATATVTNTNYGTPVTGGNFPLRESAVNLNRFGDGNIGKNNHPQDAFTYLRFGLPRAKTITTTKVPNTTNNNQNNQNSNEDHQFQPSQRRTSKHNNASSFDHQMIDYNPIQSNGDGGRQPKNSYKNFAHTKLLNDRSGSSAAINEELKRRFWTPVAETTTAPINNPTTTTTATTTTASSSSENELSSDSSAMKNHHNHNHRYKDPIRDRHSNKPLNNLNKTNNQTSNQIDHYHHHPPTHIDTSDIDDYQIHSHTTDNAHHHHHNHPYRSTFNSNDDIIDDDLDIPTNNDNSIINNHSTLPPPLAKHPHLVVKDLMYELDKSSNWRRLCGFSRQKLRILEDISFDVRGGELMAIMAASADEGTSLLNVLAAKHDYRNGMARSEIYLNGVLISAKHLSHLMAYVRNEMELECYSTMSARQALLFAGLLMGPASRSSTDVKRLTRTLLEELNLDEVRHTKLSELTYSERKRLHIAMHLLLDTELLLIDQPLIGLDIFDSFFMIEYLRQWAMIGGRIVIMTISPPTYEIFTMIHRILLISSGRALYVGQRKDFIRYFSSIGYPCPSFKNPSDYYLDLITLDDLSQEALLESSQRIDTIADIHSRRSMSEIFSSMPGPPAVLPAPFKRTNFAMQFLALWIRALIFSFPYNVVHLFNRFIITLLLSLFIGAIYWQIRTGREQEFVWDRIGFINTMISIGIVPILILEFMNAYTEKLYIISEVSQGFYSLPAYLLAKLLYSLPQSILIGIAYALPACSMAGLQLHTDPNSLPFYLLLMLSYFIAMRSFIYAVVWICKRRTNALILFSLIYTIFLLSSGINIQYRNISITHRWLRQLSPIRWLHESIVAWEFEPNILSNIDNNNSNNGVAIASSSSSFLCSRNPVIQQPNAILVRADCGFQHRSNILKWFEYQGGNIFQASSDNNNIRPSWHTFMALFLLFIISFIIGSIIFCLRVYYFDCNQMIHSVNSSKHNKYSSSNQSNTNRKHFR